MKEINDDKIADNNAPDAKHKRRHLKKSIKLLLCCLILLIVFFCTVQLYRNLSGKQNDNSKQADNEQTLQNTVINSEYNQRKTINEDYVGELTIGNNLVHQNVVKGQDNDKYLDLTWDLMNDSSGSAFMDYRNELSDQNLIIYGHYVYYDTDKMFTPLEQLSEESVYESNKDIYLKLESETRHYVITDVYHYVMDDTSMEYFQTYYTEDYFTTYMNRVNDSDFYDTGDSINYDDTWLTIQTCVRNRDDLRLIILAKEIKS